MGVHLLCSVRLRVEGHSSARGRLCGVGRGRSSPYGEEATAELGRESRQHTNSPLPLTAPAGTEKAHVALLMGRSGGAKAPMPVLKALQRVLMARMPILLAPSGGSKA